MANESSLPPLKNFFKLMEVVFDYNMVSFFFVSYHNQPIKHNIVFVRFGYGGSLGVNDLVVELPLVFVICVWFVTVDSLTSTP